MHDYTEQGISIWTGTQRRFYGRMRFSGGEMQIRLEGSFVCAPFTIVAHVRSAEDLMALLLLTDALQRTQPAYIDLVLPYLPYARQDRVCAPGEALSLRVMCDLINAQNYRTVTVWDAHSDVALALLDRVKNREQADLLSENRGGPYTPRDKTMLVAPDAGALKKVMAFSKRSGIPFVRADKTRDAADGSITGTVVYSEHIGSRNFLILDDICDGGRTFIELAKELRPLTEGEIWLYVTHGIFSRGTAVFDGLIDRVFVANSFVPEADLPSHFHLLKD